VSWNLPERKIFLSPVGNNLMPSSINHVLKGRRFVHQAGSKIHPTSYSTGARGSFCRGKSAEV
jgi:hypothetical protein